MQKKELLISIVTYNSKDIFKVLDNLKATLAGSDFCRIVLFDNNSSDAYKEKLNDYSQFAELNFYPSNEGFGFGHNYNLKGAEEPYVLILNPDVLLTQEVLLNMLEMFETDQAIGLVVPKVLNTNGTTQYLIRDQVSVFDYALRYIPYRWVKRLFDKRLARFECRALSDEQITEVRIGSGCCMLLRTEAFKAVNGFDERYFMYFEDYDLCLELAKKGYTIMYNPFTTIVHFYAKEAHKNFHLFKIFIRSMIKFFNKWGWKFF